MNQSTCKRLIIKILFLIYCTPTYAQLNYETYCNSRFSYCIDYPTTLIPQGEAFNGDGQKFTSKDKKVILTVWGINDALDSGIKGSYAEYSKGNKITYKVLKNNWFIISGYTPKGNIFYQKTMLIDGVFKTFILEYPMTEKATYDKVCQRLLNSFK
ncbi:MAG: hypothetical protein MUE81_12810 [Thermoflexibacter sp.]|nr:hypothetical protein [Thermoflexibacter sp.]